MPVARAHAALGYASAQRAQAPLDPLELEVGTAATADLFHAKEAARSYDLAYKLFPGDYHGKPLIGFKALEQYVSVSASLLSPFERLLARSPSFAAPAAALNLLLHARSSLIIHLRFLRHLRAGGKTVKQVFQLAKETEIIRQDLVRICALSITLASLRFCVSTQPSATDSALSLCS